MRGLGVNFKFLSSRVPRSIEAICYEFCYQTMLERKVERGNLKKFVVSVKNTPDKTISAGDCDHLRKCFDKVGEILAQQVSDQKTSIVKKLTKTLLLIREPSKEPFRLRVSLC